MIIVRANARNATYISDDLITSGSVGIPVTFNLSEDFDGLSAIAVFEGSGTARDVALIGNACVVPHEVVATAGGYLRIGIYAANSEGTIVIPTVWAGSKMILQGTEPSEVDPSEPTPSWVAQVQEAAAEALENSEEAIEIAGGAAAAAEDARQSASAAATSATAAGQSAEAASGSATSASGSASAAAQSATAAAGSASDAASSASAAAGSATAAAGSAAAAAASEAAAREVQESIPVDYTALSEDVSELKSQISELPNIYDSDASGVDLDITDADGNVLVRIKDGHIQTKNFDSKHKDADVSVNSTDASGVDLDITDADGNVLVRFKDGDFQTKNFNSAETKQIVADLAKNVSPLYFGKPGNEEVLFTKDDVEVGQKIVLIFTSWESTAGDYIDILNTSNSRITYIGRPSSGPDTNYFEYYTIPQNFGKAVAKLSLNSEMTVYTIMDADSFIGMNLYRIWQDKNNIPELTTGLASAQNDIVNFKYALDNKLANPLFTTFEKYNEDNPGSEIAVETALVRGTTGNAAYRIPATIITNYGTVLVCGTHMTNAIGDFGDFSVDVARKPSGGSWSISEVVPFDSTREDYGSVLNNEFLIDRSNNRVYLFYGTEKPDIIWSDVTTENGDFRYVYSDDDGESWSDPVSLKSLWDTSKYDYCIPSCTQAITLTNGTFVVPCFCKKGTEASYRSYPLLLIKRPNGNWYFSSLASVDGVPHLDECAVVEGTTENTVWLYCRPNYNYGDGEQRGYQKFIYNIQADKFIHVDSSHFESNRNNCFSVCKVTISSQVMYLMSFTDTHASERNNLTLWGSLDGNKWIRIYRINKKATAGYSVIAEYNGTIGVGYEDNIGNGGQISWQDLTPLSELIYDSVIEYIEKRITIQDRMQMLYNKLNGVD